MDNRDKTPLEFGKYRGQTPKQVSLEDPSYIVWMRKNVRPLRVSLKLANLCEEALLDDAMDYMNEFGYEEQF